MAAFASPDATGKLETLFGPTLLGKRDGEVKELPTQDALSGMKAICVYMSAHWCPPCRGFTPKFAAIYNELQEKLKASTAGEGGFEVVFVSCDRNEEQFNEYFAEMPWLALPFANESPLRDAMMNTFSVQGIPHVAIISQDGTVLVDDAVGLLAKHGSKSFPFSKERLAELSQEEDRAKQALLKDVLGDFSTFGTAERNTPSGGKEVPVSELFGASKVFLVQIGEARPGDPMQKELSAAYTSLQESTPGALEAVFLPWKDEEEEHSHEEGHHACGDGDSCHHKKTKSPNVPFPIVKTRPSQKVKDALNTLLGGVEAPHLAVFGKDDNGIPSVLVSDAYRAVRQYGTKGYPWTEARMDELKAEADARREALSKKQKNLEFLGPQLLVSSRMKEALATVDPTLKKESNSNTTTDGDEGEAAAAAAAALTTVQTSAVTEENKVVGLYFSAHWCGPCRRFTPELVKVYEELQAKDEKFEIIFLSSDKDDEAFREYFGTMPWLALPYELRELKDDLSSIFKVNGIPTLALVKGDGTLITSEGRKAVGYGAEYYPWGPEELKRGEEAAAAKAAKEKAEMEAAEDAAMAAQEASGAKAVVRRLRGVKGRGCSFNAEDSTVTFRGFTTVGVPSCSVAAGKKAYYEIEVVKLSGGVPQIGWADENFERGDEATGEGVGDGSHSWGVDGVRKLKWHPPEPEQWGSAWKEGDVIGLAADMSADKRSLSCSVNGSYDAPNGVFYENIKCADTGIYPALTAGGFVLRYNFGASPFKFAPPAEDYVALAEM